MGIGWSVTEEGLLGMNDYEGMEVYLLLEGYVKASTPVRFEQPVLTFVTDSRKSLVDAGFASESMLRSELVLGDTGRWGRM